MDFVNQTSVHCGMRRLLAAIALVTLAFPFAPVWALQDQADPPEKPAANNPSEINEGLWPSPKLMRQMLSRWAHEAAYEYDLDDQQLEKADKAVVERWTKFLDENRTEIQPLVNEFLEMRIELTPPEKTRVQDWARRAKPHFENAKKQIEEGTSQFREILRPNQRVKFEIDAVQIKVGLGLAGQKITQWETGQFEPEEFWEPVGQDRETRREERIRRRRERDEQEALRDRKRKAVDDASRDPIDVELDAWQRYVADFISTYRLDEGQRNTVLSCLTELRDRAINHRDRNRDEITRLEGRIASNDGSEAQLADIKTQLERVYGPIDEMFQELKSRMEQVPTADQRAAAAAPREGPMRDEGSGTTSAKPTDSMKSNEPASVNVSPKVPMPAPSPIKSTP